MDTSSKIAEPASTELRRAELEGVLRSELFVRAPTLAHLLSYLCQKLLAGEGDQIKEYTVALEVFGRTPSFDQDSDSIVRVEANRLRKRLAEYYAGPGKDHPLQISIPVGQYVPVFEENPPAPAPDEPPLAPPPAFQTTAPRPPVDPRAETAGQRRKAALIGLVAAALIVIATFVLVFRHRTQRLPAGTSAPMQMMSEAPVGLPVGDEIRVLAGGNRDYVDRAGKLWSADRFFTGGTPARNAAGQIWRTQDPEIYRTSRQGDFTYDVPLRPGIYELHLFFAETFYGPEDQGGGGEGSRILAVRANGQTLLANLDVVSDAGGSRTADMKVFTDISPASDGRLHLAFSSTHGGRGMVSAIEIVPGVRGKIRPVRLLARDTAYYSNDSHWWSPDNYFRGGQLTIHQQSAVGTDDPEMYQGERWGNFSYAIPVAPGKYTVLLHFVERRFGPSNRDHYVGPPHDGDSAANRTFNVFCNGKVVLRELDILREGGENRPLVRKLTGLEPNAQGKLMLDFVPLRDYATVTAIEVLPE